jgi:hypothetical protein
MPTDGQTDTTNLKATFGYFAMVHKSGKVSVLHISIFQILRHEMEDTRNLK